MPSWWRPWTWGTGSQNADNFIRNLPEGRKRHLSADEVICLSAVICALRVISEGVAQVPLKVYKETEENGRLVRRPATGRGVYTVLHRRPNAWMTSFEWRELMTLHAALYGNGYSVIYRVNGEVDELIPVHPRDMQLRFERGEVFYRATIEGKNIDLLMEDVFHLRGPSMDGIEGLPMVHLMRDVFDMTHGLEQAQQNWTDNNNRPSGILAMKPEGSKALSPERKEAMRDAWQQRFGPGGKGGVAVLDGDMTFMEMSMKAVDQQHLETRSFQIEEIGRAFRVQTVMLMHAANSPTYASAEQFFQAHVVHTLGPWIERWENSLDRTFFADDNSVYSHFVMGGLMRGTAADRAQYYTAALGSGGTAAWMTQNEVRALEELDPVEGGDELFRGSQNVETQEVVTDGA